MAKVSDEAKYEQLCQDFRSLNGFFWQTPLIVMTLTGGLWFSVANFDLSPMARTGLLLFAGVADLLMMVALRRLRAVMEVVQEQIRDLDDRRVIGRSNIILLMFSALMVFAAVGSFIAMFQPNAVFMKRPATVAAHGTASAQTAAAPKPAPAGVAAAAKSAERTK